VISRGKANAWPTLAAGDVEPACCAGCRMTLPKEGPPDAANLGFLRTNLWHEIARRMQHAELATHAAVWRERSIHTHIATGHTMPAFTRISAVRDDTDQWQIDQAELFIPGAKPPPPRVEQDTATLNELVKLLREQLEDVRAQVADLRQDRDHWREAFEATQRRLPGTLYNSLARVDAACEALRASHRTTTN
jgi:hypothetical protein